MYCSRLLEAQTSLDAVVSIDSGQGGEQFVRRRRGPDKGGAHRGASNTNTGSSVTDTADWTSDYRQGVLATFLERFVGPIERVRGATPARG
jgi:hypothetical protein